MTDLYFIRHAESARNLTTDIVCGRSNDVLLSPKGRTQAARLGRWLVRSGMSADMVYSSPAVRSIATAEISMACAFWKNELVVDERLQEVSQGAYEGRVRAEVYTPEMQAVSRDDMHFRPEGGESISDGTQRILDFTQEQTENGYAIVVAHTHGLVLRSLVGHIKGWDKQRIITESVDNASLVHIRAHTSDELEVLGYNVDTQRKGRWKVTAQAEAS